MLNFPLIPGDKYEGRCAEIYITEKQFLVYHCSICDEIYATFNDLLSHITKDHYENTKEYHEEGKATSVATVNNILLNHANENQFVKKELQKTTAKDDPNTEMANKAVVLAILKNEDQKNTPQRKKPRMVSSLLKNYSLNRTKTNALTRGHQLNANEESKYICSLCGFAFKEKLNLRTHLLRHSKQKNFNCSMCPKKFYTKTELRLHEYRHKAERPYLCKNCGMGFLSNQSLTQHVKNLHSQQSPIKCEQKNQWPTQKEQHVHPYRKDSELETTSQANKKSDFNSHYKNHHNHSTSLSQKDNKECSKLSLIESSDEYELVQTLTDLECNKNE